MHNENIDGDFNARVNYGTSFFEGLPAVRLDDEDGIRIKKKTASKGDFFHPRFSFFLPHPSEGFCNFPFFPAWGSLMECGENCSFLATT